MVTCGRPERPPAFLAFCIVHKLFIPALLTTERGGGKLGLALREKEC